MIFAKIENHAITLAPREIGGVIDPPAEVYLANGWYPVTLTEPPDFSHRYEPDFEQREDNIVQVWSLQSDIDDAEAFDIIFGGAE